MTAEQDGRTPVVLTFSGEICNCRELRADLISRGTAFVPRATPRWSSGGTWSGAKASSTS